MRRSDAEIKTKTTRVDGMKNYSSLLRTISDDDDDDDDNACIVYKHTHTHARAGDILSVNVKK